MPSQISLVDIAEHQKDAEASLRLFFSSVNPSYNARFVSYLPSEVTEELAGRISETDMRSALVVMARVEAAFRDDYKLRRNAKMSDAISIVFRKIAKKCGDKEPRLSEDIWETWRQQSDNPQQRMLISKLRSVFKFRHWLAHGRHWQVGTTYDFQDIYLLADNVFVEFPLLS
jgi:hypothetical protein